MKLDRAKIQRCAANPARFRDSLRIETATGEIKRFELVEEPWQAEAFARIDPILVHAAGRGPAPSAMKAWDERPRGHSKSSDAAACILWMLLFSTRPTHQILVAKDWDQANLILKFLARLIDLNGLSTFLTVQKEQVINKSGGPSSGSTVSVISQDWRGSFGLLVSGIWADELCHWDASGEQMWFSILTTSDKRGTACALFVLTNAGTDRGTSWQWKAREIARTSDAWVFGSLEGCRASWITEKALRDQRRGLPRNVFLRLWMNQWVAGGDDGIDPLDIEAATTAHSRMHVPVDGWSYYIGCDMGISSDLASIVTVAVTPQRRIRVVDVMAWKPRIGRPVDGAAVRQYLYELIRVFNPVCVRCDPWEMRILIQDLQAAGHYQIEEFTFSSASNRKELASALFACFRERIIDAYPDPDFIAELYKINFIDKGSHFELSAARDARGHCDRIYALALALVPATRAMHTGEFVAPSSLPREPSRTVAAMHLLGQPNNAAAADAAGPLRKHGITADLGNWDKWNRRPLPGAGKFRSAIQFSRTR